MSNERIDQILEETIPFFRANEERSPHYADLIRKAMEQYAMEEFKMGYDDGFNTVNESLRPEIRRLQALVQAQKELIRYLEAPESCQDIRNGAALRNRIKELEK